MGSGYKTFTAGAVLTASDVQNYLQDQSVMVFGGTAARSSAIGTANFEEGMLTYLTDVDKLQVYTGATFADVYPPATSNQGLTLINTTAFSAVASQNLTSIFSSTYANYKIVYDNLSGSTGTTLRGRLGVAGTPKTASYYYGAWLVNHTGTTGTGSGNNQGSIFLNEVATGPTNTVGMEITFFNPNQAVCTTYNYQGFCAQQLRMHVGSGNIGDVSQMTDFQIFPDSGTITGTARVYGFNN